MHGDSGKRELGLYFQRPMFIGPVLMQNRIRYIFFCKSPSGVRQTLVALVYTVNNVVS